jgi:(1->4)-alpha-D-glucan 1-alpha-D-glucosylmutase
MAPPCRRAAELKAELARFVRQSDDVRDAISLRLRRFNGTPGEEAGWHDLRDLINDQYWRAAHFRVAADDINYRRFFNVNDLAGIRMELPDVFDHAHALVLRLLQYGILDGLRIDHVDGLLNPKEYLQRLRVEATRPEPAEPFYLVVEKILARHEGLREDWPVDGTTGYEFTNLVLGLLIDPTGEAGFTQTYAEFTGERSSFADIVRDCKMRVMRNEMASELNVLGRDAARVAHQNPRTADFTQNILRRVIREVVACFPVYRTYVGEEGKPSENDRRDLDWAMKQARAHETDVDSTVFDFVYKLLSGDLVAEDRSGFSRHTVLRLAMKLQQYSGPVMAKGLEDTAFYRYNRFIALNEVGGAPDQFGVHLSAFHKANALRAKRWPNSMVTTSTHDTKRGEDTRARLAVLSEMPDEWSKQVQAWSRLLRARRGDIQAAAPPDRNEEYMFYQLLIGTWPVGLQGGDRSELDAAALKCYAERLKGAMIKSLREAKVHSTWASPDKTYEDAVSAFVDDALDPNPSRAFLGSFLPFQQRIARLAVQNSLAQVTLKLTVPGVPDIYQGAELWDLSMVDPDNRRPIDFDERIRLLNHTGDCFPGLLKNWEDGAIKLLVSSAILRFRSANPALFAQGEYEPLTASGPKAGLICAFLRRLADSEMIVAVARFPAHLEADPSWAETTLCMPKGAPRTWQNLFTAAELAITNDTIQAAQLFEQLPIAVLSKKC